MSGMLKTLMLENSYNTPRGPESERESLDWAHTWKSKWVLPSSHAVKSHDLSCSTVRNLLIFSLYISKTHFCSPLILLFAHWVCLTLKISQSQLSSSLCQTTQLTKSVRSEWLVHQWTRTIVHLYSLIPYYNFWRMQN